MNVSRRLIAIGRVPGTAAFVAVGLLLLVAAERPAPIKLAPPQPLNQSDVAPAQALSEAFETVAAHIRPTVVSVYSEKISLAVSPSPPPREIGGVFKASWPEARSVRNAWSARWQAKPSPPSLRG